jgi:peptidoglycan/xylan/chitin deacetylase (PgdA/CDA1 family)
MQHLSFYLILVCVVCALLGGWGYFSFLRHPKRYIRIGLLSSLSLLFVATLAPPASALTVPGAEAKVALTFDDGFASTYNYALPILSQRSIPATAFVTTKFIDNGITGDNLPAMSWQQVVALQNQYGWEIGSHTVTHPELPTISISQMKREVSSSKSILESKGLNVTSFATPYGAYNNTTLAEVLKSYNIHRGFRDRDHLNAYPYDRSVITVQSVVTGVSYTQVKSWIDQAISQKKWLVLVFHEVRPSLLSSYKYTTTTSELTQIADYIKQTGIRAVTMNHTLQKPGQNLLPNGTFASGISSGWTTGDTAYVMADSTNNGSYPSPVDSVKLSGNTSTSSLSSPAVHATATSIYGFQAFINSNTLSSGHVAYYANEYDATGNQISQTLLGSVSSQQVKYFTALYQPSSSRVDSFRIQTTVSAGGRGTAYVDDYELYDLGQTQPAANLVANGQ